MNNTAFRFVIILIACLQSCLSKEVVTVWKSEQPGTVTYSKLTVAAILPEGNDSLRGIIEAYSAERLSSLGYHAVSSLKVYGPKGLSSLSEEATYHALCDSGIDAILIVAMVENKHSHNKTVKGNFSSAYYYQRIWNYKPLLDRSEATLPATKLHYHWESILFDLRLLEAKSVIQVKQNEKSPEKKNARHISDLIINEMQRTKVIAKRKKSL